METCYPICTSIEKTAFAEDKLVMLFAGCSAAIVWSQGIIVENDIATALAFT